MIGEAAGRGHAPIPPAATAADPHAGVPGAPPLGGAVAAGAPATDPTVRERLRQAQAAAQLDPSDFGTLVNLGNSAYDAHEFAQAIDAYEKALMIRSDDPNVLTDLGTAYRNQGQLDRALELFRKARALDPRHWQSLYNEVVVLALDKHEHEAADAALARLKKEHPGLPAIEALERQIGAAHGGK